jgi:hypothetical protein
MPAFSHLLHFRGESRNVTVSAPIGAVLFFGALARNMRSVNSKADTVRCDGPKG